jgi:hypothetical protein
MDISSSTVNDRSVVSADSQNFIPPGTGSLTQTPDREPHDAKILRLQQEINSLKLQNEELKDIQTQTVQARLTPEKKLNRWTCFNAHMMKILNNVLGEETVPSEVQKELCIKQMQDGTIVSDYTDKNTNQIIQLRELGGFSGNVQGIMKHCGRLWSSLPVDVKSKWTKYAIDLNQKNVEQRRMELNGLSAYKPSD